MTQWGKIDRKIVIITTITHGNFFSHAAMNIYKVALNSLSAHIAILDEHGVIIETNLAWKEFAEQNGLLINPGCIGINYIELCRNSSRALNDEPAVIAQAIEKVISGDIKEFFINYPCHALNEKRWFALRIIRFRQPGSRKLVLTHENITPLIQVQRSLSRKEHLLREQTGKLEESNIALKVLLQHRNEDRISLEENMLANVRELILPYIEKLENSGLKSREHAMVEIIKERLMEITSPFLNRLSSLNQILTPQEIHVATMVREGRASKEIADFLMISVSAVDFHRKQIRKKLELTGSGKNLRSHLLSLQ